VSRENVFSCLGQAHEFEIALAKYGITFKDIQDVIDGKKNISFSSAIAVDHSALLADWQAFYRDVFGIEIDFLNLTIPEKRAGFDRLLILSQGMTLQRLYDKCGELFPSWKWTDENLDKIVTSDRTAKDGAYAIWIRDRVEADEELKNRSADNLKKQGISGNTLEERFAYELKYFRETGKHLDINNVTLCTGSRDDDGDVPNVGWRGGGLDVRWDDSGDADDGLRSRQVVS